MITGIVVIVVLSIGTDAALIATGVFPAHGQPMTDGLFLLATIYRTLYAILGSYLAARLAPDRPMAHALALGIVGLVVSILGAVTTWNTDTTAGLSWYPLALVVLALPPAWVGGRLREMQLHAR
ncbi:hypothetical protein [Paludisphaera borealis]|uniref:hypothetical protein n=1 Tax=Paludisphaera borealis TaxID=1387353 RepID=UPI001AEFCF48|nr:hypothetical protein [Paludisphaera borealis]